MHPFRRPVLGALGLLGTQVLVIWFVGAPPVGPVLSDLIQLALGLLTAVASFRAAQRSTSFGKAFWKLAGLGFSIWCIGQMLGTYYGSILNVPTQRMWTVDVFYNTWTAPLIMCLFLDPEAESAGLDWAQILDFSQIAIFVVLVYLYFSNLAAQDQVPGDWRLAMTMDGLTTAGFFVRALSGKSDPRVAKLFRQIGYYRLAALLTDSYFVAGLPEPLNAHWFDLVWSLPWLIPLIAATSWNEVERPLSHFRSHSRVRLLVTQLLPLLFPVLVLLTAAQIARVQLEIAAGAVLVSLGISYARLLYTQKQQQRSADALRRTHGLLEAIIEGTSDAIYVKDLQGRYIMINGAGAKLLGRPVAEVSGKDDREFFSPETARLIMEKDRQVMLSGEPETYEETGEAAGVTRTYLSTKAPHRDSEGNIIGLIGISVDITERKRTEDALAQSEERFRSVFQESPIGIVVMGMDGRAIAINSAYRKMLELGEDEPVSNKLLNELTFPENRGADDARYRQVASGAVDHDQREKHYSLRSGRNVWAELNLLLLRDRAGQPRYVLIMALDITERKRLEEQLRQAQKMEAVGTLSGGVAHDFNNLLTVIKGYSRIMLDSLQKDSELRGQVERIDEAAERAAALTRQLLAFSRRQVLQPRVFNINSLVGNLDKMLRRMIGEDIEMVTATERDLGCVKADSGQMEQVIMNLVVNARDAMPKGGKLTLETANVNLDETYSHGHEGVTPGPYVVLAVSDTGSGMNTETLAHIFEPFFTTKEMGKGTGLGLSMVYGIVKQSGGHIWVYSEPSRGTTFKVYLPRADVPSEAVPSDQRAASTIRGIETILLAEDDVGVQELARAVLSACGYSVLAGDSRTALSLSSDHSGPIHLLLTDVVMPGLSGRELADKVRTRRPEIKILYMSGYTNNAILHHGVLDDDTFFLQKPFTPIELATKVREVLDDSSASPKTDHKQ